MKVTKYLIGALGAVVVLLAAAWFARNALIQRVSNPLLQEFNIVVTDVSLDALATSDATIGYLKLVHDKGTSIVIEDLTLPIGTAPSKSRIFRAEKVSIITATRKEGEPFELAHLIDQFLSLPGKLGEIELTVSEFNLPPYPTVYDLSWILTGNKQQLRAYVESIAMSATVTRADATDHGLIFSLEPGSATTPGHAITADIQQSDQGISLSGNSSIDLPSWEPIAKLPGIIPQQIDIQSGTATIRFAVEIPYDTNLSPSLTAELAAITPLQLTYAKAPDEITSIDVQSGSPIDVTASFPEVEWSLRQAQTSLLVSYDEWEDIPVSVSNLACESGPVCSMNTRIAMDAAELPFGEVSQIEFSSTENITFPDEGVRVDVQQNATLEIANLVTTATRVEQISARLASAAKLELVDIGWRLEAGSLDASIQAMSLSDDVEITTPLFLENVVVSELDQVLSVESGVYVPTSQAAWNDQIISLPGFKGDFARRGANIAFDLKSVGLHRNGSIKIQHNLGTSSGQLVVSDTAMSFETKKLSSRVSPWNNNWDLAAGTVFIDLQANWIQSDSRLRFDGHSTARIDNLAGYYADTAFVGMSTNLETDYDSANGFSAKQSTISVALIEMGLPVENISASYELDPNALAFRMKDLRMTAFGGVIRADPFSFHTERESNTVLLRAESIELDALLTLKEFEAVEVTGSIGAALPLTIEGGTVTIIDGTLTGEPPGGVIRYLPGRDSDMTDDSSIGLVTRALSNFEYDSLMSDVNYGKDGDLKLQLRLTGRNPDLDEERPVILNLGVENNVPEMLKSLRAARTVEEILEKRLKE